MRDLAQDSGEYLSALRNIHSLVLYNTLVEHISREDFRTCFSAFRETLTYLFLHNFTTSFSAFVTLVDYFPNITTLQLSPFKLEDDEGPVQSLSRPLRGKLRVRECRDSYLFFNQFSKLDLEYEELIIDSSYSLTKVFLESAFQISTSTIKCLRLASNLNCE